MATVKIKIICNEAASSVHTCLQTSTAVVGEARNTRTVEITDVPAATTAAEVLKLWRETTDASWLGNEGEYPRHSYRFEEIGHGRIIR
jgi:hypothetical protein